MYQLAAMIFRDHKNVSISTFLKILFNKFQQQFQVHELLCVSFEQETSSVGLR